MGNLPVFVSHAGDAQWDRARFLHIATSASRAAAGVVKS
jgi:hypothetical protein